VNNLKVVNNTKVKKPEKIVAEPEFEIFQKLPTPDIIEEDPIVEEVHEIEIINSKLEFSSDEETETTAATKLSTPAPITLNYHPIKRFN
jgi:hypothetical protein